VSNAVDISGRQAINGQQVRFLGQDPVPPSLRGREATLEQATDREAVVQVGGSRRRVPVNWLTASSRSEQGSTASVQTASHSGLTQPVDVAGTRQCSDHAGRLDPIDTDDSDGDDDPITKQGWDSLLEACRELGIGRKSVLQIIAEATGIPVDEIDPSRLTWRNFLQVIERLEALQGQPDQPAPPPPLPSPPPPPAAHRETTKAIYPPPSKYLGVAAYNELRAIASNLGLDEEEMVARLGIPADCPGYLLDRPWIFAIARGLAAIAAGRQPGQPNPSKAVLKFGYRSEGGPKLVIVGLDGTLLHGDPEMVLDWAKQLRIPVEGSNAGRSITGGGIPQPDGGEDPTHSQVGGEYPTTTIQPKDSFPCRAQNGGLQRTFDGSPTTSSAEAPKTQSPQGQPAEAVPQSDDDPVVDRGWAKLMEVCCEAGVTVENIRQVLSDATGIPKHQVEEIPLTRSRYQQAMAYLAHCKCGVGDR